jgi:glycosyltransferase involved in cell wall biosynthesis
LVLTGPGTERDSRTLELRLRESGIDPDTPGIFGLGLVDDHVYFSTLGAASVLAAPSFNEGGGSYPVAEAMQLGVPVLCADIPPIREQVESTGGRVVWANPSDPRSIRAGLLELLDPNEDWQNRAREQAPRLKWLSWRDIAAKYVAEWER